MNMKKIAYGFKLWGEYMERTVLIIGAGNGGTAILNILLMAKDYRVIGVVDSSPDAAGIQLARKQGIKTAASWSRLINHPPDIIFEATGIDAVYREIAQKKEEHTILVQGRVAFILANLIQEKEELMKQSKEEAYLRELVFNISDNGMIVINKEEEVVFINKEAENLTGLRGEMVIGRHIHEVMPASSLPRIVQTAVTESNQRACLDNGRDILTTRMPIRNGQGEILGAFAIFKGITEMTRLAEEITNLKHIQKMLEAIIYSSDDAISVVDEKGEGLLINPAYSRITGLEEADVIGKPATADIVEGESMHLQVLKTQKPVRGARMKVGPAKRDVIVNVAPIMVNGELKGSVGVLHDLSEIQNLTLELQRARQMIRKIAAKYTFDDIIGGSKEMSLCLEQARLYARTSATVLLRGESGTGKELFAHAIHNASDRRYNQFVRVNCAAIAESLLESELFGYEEGAFSGARRGGKKGFFEEAHKGSIFLDEIGELTPGTQAKLLRVLQEGEFMRVGGTKPLQIDVRVIAATNVNLEKAIANGDFREDLYYRINRMPIYIPPLRERPRDIAPLSIHLLKKLNEEYGRDIRTISPEAIQVLEAYRWPGNVRELENVLGRAIIFMDMHTRMLEKAHLPSLFLKDAPTDEGWKEQSRPHNPVSLAEQLANIEKEIIQNTLNRLKGNKTATARELGLSIRNLYYKLTKYNLE